MIDEQVKENNQDKKKVVCLPKFMFLEQKAYISAYVQLSSQGYYCVHMHVCTHVCPEVPTSTLVSMSCGN